MFEFSLSHCNFLVGTFPLPKKNPTLLQGKAHQEFIAYPSVSKVFFFFPLVSIAMLSVLNCMLWDHSPDSFVIFQSPQRMCLF